MENVPATRADGSPQYAPDNQYYAPYETEETRGGNTLLKRLVAAVLYYKWLVLLIAAAGSAASFYPIKGLPLVYQAEATMWLSSGSAGGNQSSSSSQGPIQAQQVLQNKDWIELLKSFSVLDSVVIGQRLYVTNHWRDDAVTRTLHLDSIYEPGDYALKVDAQAQTLELRTDKGELLETAPVGSAIGQKLGFTWQPERGVLRPNRVVQFTILRPDAAAKKLSAKLTPKVSGNFMSVTYEDEDPTRAAAVLNAVIDRYVVVAADLKRDKLAELRDILESQLAVAGANLRQAELELESFKVTAITLPSEMAAPAGTADTRGTAVSSFFAMKLQREELRRDAEAIASALSQGPSGTSSLDALSILPSVQNSPELRRALTDLTDKRAQLRALRLQYTVEHPLVIRAAAEVDSLDHQVIPALGSSLVRELTTRVTQLDGYIADASSELRTIPPRAIDEARLERAVASAEHLYTDLLQRYETTNLATVTTLSDISIRERARAPQQAMTDKRVQYLLMAGVASALLGVAVAVLLDLLGPKIRYPEQVTQTLRLTILGAVPDFSSRRFRTGRPTDKRQIVEALRGLRLNVSHAYGAAGPMVLTITSPAPGDGKTFVTSNLALAFADLGMNTLIIDGDTRRGDVHKLLDAERRPGLSDYLAGTASIQAVLRQTSHRGLDLITSGSRLRNSPELLASGRMGDLMAHVRTRYQVILVDSPPLGAGVDPLVLATMSGHMVLVMRTDKTDLALAEAKLEMVDRLPVRIVGAVLNGVRGNTGYRYYSYLPGYEAGEEEAEISPALQVV